MRKDILLLLGCIIFLASHSFGYGTNKIFKKEAIKKVMLKTAEWQIKHPKHAQNDWTNAAFYAGMFAAWEATKSQSIYKAMLAMGEDSTQWQPYRRWYHADDIAICQTYIDLYQIEKQQKMIRPTLDTLAILLNNPYPYKGIQVIKWWWCDALFMGPPVLVKMSKVTGDDKYAKANDTYFKECYNLLYNKEERLFPVT